MDATAVSQAKQPVSRPKVQFMPRGLRERLMVAFALMSIMPLLVLGYVVTNYVFPHLDRIWDLSLVVGLALWMALLGFGVARGMIFPVIKIASQIQEIAAGDLGKQVDHIQSPEEVRTLGVALNQITQRVRENMAQLRVYGEQTKHLNLEINRRILAFSHLLQVSNLISQSAKIEEVRAFILEKLSQMEEAELNCVLEPSGKENQFVIRAAMGVDSSQAQALLHSRVVAPWLQRVLRENRILVLDGQTGASHESEFLQQMFGMSNAVCQPLTSMGQGIGILVSANRKEGFAFNEDVLDLLKVFARQLGLAMENDLLTKRAEELKVIDELTGLYNAGYMKSRLEEEIRRAARYHRPCSVAVFRLDDFREFQDLYGGLTAEGVVRQVAEILKGQVSEVDRLGRLGPGEFAVILPEKNKREAIDLAETVRHRVEEYRFMNGVTPLTRTLTISGGVSENPLDGATGEDLWEKAGEAARRAQVQGKNRVVASTPAGGEHP